MPYDPDTAIGGPRDRFPSTRLSLIETAAAGEALRNEALEQVAALYWKPVYKYIRLKWNKSNEEAKDLTQSFFASAIERDFFDRFDPKQASFRTYLRMALDHFAANQHIAAKRQKRGGAVTIAALDFDAAEAEAIADPGRNRLKQSFIASGSANCSRWLLKIFARIANRQASNCSSGSSRNTILQTANARGTRRLPDAMGSR